MSRRIAMWILWPSFLTSAMAAIALFALIDPHNLELFDMQLLAPRIALYTVWFFVLWISAALSSAISLYLVPGLMRRIADEDLDGL